MTKLLTNNTTDPWNVYLSTYTGAVLYHPVYEGLDSSDYTIESPNYQIEAVLEIQSFERDSTKCRTRFVFKDITTNHIHKMFPDDMIDMFQRTKVTFGTVSGVWGFTQLNDHTGIRFLHAPKTKNASHSKL